MMAVTTRTNKGVRPPRPPRAGFSTSRASGPTFQELSRGGMGAATTKGLSYAPFSGPDAAAEKAKYVKYDITAQGCIARALAEPQIAENIDRSQGTAPELVVLGDALLDGMILGHDLFWQSATFRDPVFNPSGRAFPVDIFKLVGGDQWFEPVDGAYFHLSDLIEIERDIERNNALAANGHVCVVSDAVCFSRAMLRQYLDSKGAP